ncbi:MAG: sodium/proline symporter [Elainellaceae cyanobacterium]
MLERAPVAVTFFTFIALFIGVGLYSGTRRQDTTEDYLLAGRGVGPWFTALSAVATGNSGFMFIGLIGFTYQMGISAVWLTVGHIVGDTLAWLSVHQRLRRVSGETQAETVSSFLGQGLAGERWVTLLSALITLGFLGIYAAAQLQAGSKAMSVLFDWPAGWGVAFGAAVVAIYCIGGGIRASIWVGSVQSVLMMVSMIALAGVAIARSGGLGGLWAQLSAIDSSLVSLAPSGLAFGVVPFVLSWTLSGFGVVGQPPIMVRAMAIDSVEGVSAARNIYILFNAVFSVAAVAVGLTARVLLPALAFGDAELALPELAVALLPALLVGLVLVGLFSATISTADAQLLSCSAALTQDLLPKGALNQWALDQGPLKRITAYQAAKLGTLMMVVVVLGIALVSTDNVFVLVTFAWAALAASLGSVMVVRVMQWRLNGAIAIAMMVSGIGTALAWRVGLHLSSDVYEVLPGMAASGLVYAIARPFLRPKAS